jgi:hypothetical protein
MIISFAPFSWYVLFPIGYGTFIVLRMVLFADGIVPKKNSPLNSTFISSLSLLSMGFLELIAMKKQQHKKQAVGPILFAEEDETPVSNDKKVVNPRTQIEFIDSGPKSIFTKTDLINYGVILIISITNFWINFYVFNIPEITQNYINVDTEVRFLGILYVCYLCKKVLRDEFRKHHIFSLGLIIVCDVILCLVNIIILALSKEKIDSKLFQRLAWYLFSDIYYSSKHVTEKWLMDKRYFSPYKLLFIEGIFYFIINILVMFSFSFITCPDSIEYCKNGNMFEIENFYLLFTNSYIFVIGFFSATFLVELCMTSTSKYYTPALRPIFDSLTTIVQLIYEYKTKETQDTVMGFYVTLIKLILYSLILIGCLVFNEAIMLGIFGLDKDLKDVIADRGQQEYYNNVSKLNRYMEEENNMSKRSENSSMLAQE